MSPNKHVGLPLVKGARLTRVLCLRVIHRGEVAVATRVIHRQRRALVVRLPGWPLIERLRNHRRIRRKVQAQINQRGLTRLARRLAAEWSRRSGAPKSALPELSTDAAMSR